MFLIKNDKGFVEKLEGTSWRYTEFWFRATNFENSNKANEFIGKNKVANAKLKVCMPCG